METKLKDSLSKIEAWINKITALINSTDENKSREGKLEVKKLNLGTVLEGLQEVQREIACNTKLSLDVQVRNGKEIKAYLYITVNQPGNTSATIDKLLDAIFVDESNDDTEKIVKITKFIAVVKSFIEV